MKRGGQGRNRERVCGDDSGEERAGGRRGSVQARAVIAATQGAANTQAEIKMTRNGAVQRRVFCFMSPANHSNEFI